MHNTLTTQYAIESAVCCLRDNIRRHLQDPLQDDYSNYFLDASGKRKHLFITENILRMNVTPCTHTCEVYPVVTSLAKCKAHTILKIHFVFYVSN